MMRGLPTWSKRRYAESWRTRAAASRPNEIRYVALGDSAAQGIGATAPRNGYVGLLASLGERHSARPVRVINLSVSGAKTRDVIEGQLPRLAALGADIVTCAIGGNDIRRFDADRFEVEIREIARTLPAHALLADVPCFYSGRGEVRSREATAIVRREADAAVRTLVELHAATENRTRAEVRGDFALDMFHPNDRGYTVWAAAFEPAFLTRLDTLASDTAPL
ncbi:lysophospholipase L1-like esterase [Marisediminicola sp. UYEF4]|uniref:SGNH/GDSL hydrolase family protein n=1 Tax=Marisediminicola sp. UYEF4 TaxID=1756384 RepID=UPI003398D876